MVVSCIISSIGQIIYVDIRREEKQKQSFFSAFAWCKVQKLGALIGRETAISFFKA